MSPLSIPACPIGEEALTRGAWAEAREAFEEAIQVHELPELLEGLGIAAWWLDRAELVFDARERAYRLYQESGNHAGAGRVAVWLAWDSWAFRGEGAVASGWLQRARRLLEKLPDCPERAWLEVREAALCLLETGDPVRALAMAAEGIRIAVAVRDTNYEMLGRAVHGLALVVSGSVPEGMRSLDEVNAAVIAGELTDLVCIGLANCYMIAACERVRDCERALQWCARLKVFSAKWGLRPLFSVCRTQYASICLWRGTWQEAELELRAASDELSVCRPAMAGDALVHLAELRRRQGRVAEATALFEKVQPHGLGLLGRAQLASDSGDHRAAEELAARYLRHLPAQNRTERAVGLELQVRALTGLKQTEAARVALTELSSIAAQMDTLPLRAASLFAAGFVAMAEGKPDAARQHFEDAVDLFTQCKAPYEIARSRIELARALGKLGRTATAMEEAECALSVLSDLGAELDMARAQRLLLELAANLQPDPQGSAEGLLNGNLTRREIEVLRLVAEGLNNQNVAERLFVSDHTVHRHLANIFSKLKVSTRAAAVAQGARRGLLP